jgi:hypothetical protein
VCSSDLYSSKLCKARCIQQEMLSQVQERWMIYINQLLKVLITHSALHLIITPDANFNQPSTMTCNFQRSNKLLAQPLKNTLQCCQFQSGAKLINITLTYPGVSTPLEGVVPTFAVRLQPIRSNLEYMTWLAIHCKLWPNISHTALILNFSLQHNLTIFKHQFSQIFT